LKYYADIGWNCGETCESIEWKDTTTENTKDHLESLWQELKKRYCATRKK